MKLPRLPVAAAVVLATLAWPVAAARGQDMAAMGQEAMATLEARLALAPPPATGIAEGLRDALSGRLSDPAALAELSARIERDWPSRPEWADMARALLEGEGIGPGRGWWRPASRLHDWPWLRERYDLDGDGCIAGEELAPAAAVALPGGLAAQALARLDRDRSGFVTEEDLDAARRPEPGSPERIAATLLRRADADSNGRVSPDEWLALYSRADAQGTGFVVAEELARVLDPGPSAGGDLPPAQVLLTMLFTGQMGELDEGPALGALAPPGELRVRGRPVTRAIASGAGSRPVVVVFGSFT